MKPQRFTSWHPELFFQCVVTPVIFLVFVIIADLGTTEIPYSGLNVLDWAWIACFASWGWALTFVLPKMNYVEFTAEELVWRRGLVTCKLAWKDIEQVRVQKLGSLSSGETVVFDLKDNKGFPFPQAIKGYNVDGALLGKYRVPAAKLAETVQQFRSSVEG